MKTSFAVIMTATLMLCGCDSKVTDSTTVTHSSPEGQQSVTITKTVVEPPQADKATTDKATTEQLAAKSRETLQIAGELAAQTKDEFVAEAKRRLANIDSKIKEWDAQSESMTAAAKEKWSAEREKLHQKQVAMQLEIEKLQGESAAAWADVKAGATAAWKNLADGFQAAAEHFNRDSETKPASE